MSLHIILSLISVFALASIHLFAGRIHGGARVRPAWLTAASGMSVAYVFVHLLPELAETQSEWLESRYRMFAWLGTGVYVAALAGLILSLLLDRVGRKRGNEQFWISIAGFSAYNALLGGFALSEFNIATMVLGVIAFGAHFLINDRSLYRRYGALYERSGRWLLSASIVVGWLIAVLWRIPTLFVALVVALVAGGMILNVIKEEMPERDGGRLSPWIAGAVTYTVLILALTYTTRR